MRVDVLPLAAGIADVPRKQGTAKSAAERGRGTTEHMSPQEGVTGQRPAHASCHLAVVALDAIPWSKGFQSLLQRSRLFVEALRGSA